MTLAPAPICESPGVTWQGRAGSPEHNSEKNQHRCPPSFWFLCRQISGNQIGRADFRQHPLRTFPYPGGRAAREFSYGGGERIWCSGPCEPLDLTARLQSEVLPVLPLNTTLICSSHAPSCKRRLQFIFSSWEKEGRQGGKKREAADSKRRIKVQLPLGAKSREGTGRGEWGEVAKRELPIKTSAESPGGGGGGGAGRVTSP